jgi:hypothetical protein
MELQLLEIDKEIWWPLATHANKVHSYLNRLPENFKEKYGINNELNNLILKYEYIKPSNDSMNELQVKGMKEWIDESESLLKNVLFKKEKINSYNYIEEYKINEDWKWPWCKPVKTQSKAKKGFNTKFLVTGAILGGAFLYMSFNESSEILELPEEPKDE